MTKFEIRCNKHNKKGGKCHKLIGITESKNVTVEFVCPSCKNKSIYKNGEVK